MQVWVLTCYRTTNGHDYSMVIEGIFLHPEKVLKAYPGDWRKDDRMYSLSTVSKRYVLERYNVQE